MFRGLGDPHCQAWRVDRGRVVAVCPSVTDTNMVRAALQMLSPADQERAGNEGRTKLRKDSTITEKVLRHCEPSCGPSFQALDQEACLRNLGILQPGDIAAAAGNLIKHGRPGEVVSVNQGRYQHIDQISRY